MRAGPPILGSQSTVIKALHLLDDPCLRTPRAVTQTVNNEQVKQSKNILLNTQLGKIRADRRAMNF